MYLLRPSSSSSSSSPPLQHPTPLQPPLLPPPPSPRLSRYICSVSALRLLLFLVIINHIVLLHSCDAACVQHRQQQQQQQVRSSSPLSSSSSSSSSSSADDHNHYHLNDEALKNNLTAIDETLDPVSHAGLCVCVKESFMSRFWHSFGVVRCKMVASRMVRGRNSMIELIEYDFKPHFFYSGPPVLRDPSKRFSVRAFSNPNLCGLRFRRHVDYLLLLDDPKQNSAAGNTDKNTFFVDQCSQPYNFRKLSAQNRDFLLRSRKA